jgi:hypothetical protein
MYGGLQLNGLPNPFRRPEDQGIAFLAPTGG